MDTSKHTLQTLFLQLGLVYSVEQIDALAAASHDYLSRGGLLDRIAGPFFCRSAAGRFGLV